MSLNNKDKVKLGTLLAARTAEAAHEFCMQEKPFIIEQPKWKQDSKSVSMYNLDEFSALLEQAGVSLIELSQCKFGAKTTKPTTLVALGLSEHNLNIECDHPSQHWRKPSTGEHYWGAHPPLVGKEWYVPASDWHSDMLKTPAQICHEFEDRPFLTSAAQAYPGELNEALAKALITSSTMVAPSAVEKDAFTLCGRWNNVLVWKADFLESTVRSNVEFTVPLKGLRKRPLDRDTFEEQFWGGMRNPKAISQALPKYRTEGQRLYAVLQRFSVEYPDAIRTGASLRLGPRKQMPDQRMSRYWHYVQPC